MFSCPTICLCHFSAKIFFMASSFRMMLFPPCEAMTTAEPPELLIFQHSDSIMNNKLLRRLSARRRGIQCNPYYYRSFSCFLTTIFSMRFSVARSAFTTAAAAGAVCIILNQRLVSSLNPQDVVGPAARLFSVFSVFCGLKFRALSCLSWLLKTFGCGQQPLQVFCGLL